MTGLLHALAKRRICWLTVWLTGALAAAAVQGQTVYRCANGSYTDAPCPGGRTVDVADPRSPEQQRQASDAARREQALAGRMDRERRAAERQSLRQPPPLVGISRRPPEAPAAAAPAASTPKAQRKRSDKTAAKGKPTTRQRAAAAPGRDTRQGRLGQY